MSIKQILWEYHIECNLLACKTFHDDSPLPEKAARTEVRLNQLAVEYEKRIREIIKNEVK